MHISIAVLFLPCKFLEYMPLTLTLGTDISDKREHRTLKRKHDSRGGGGSSEFLCFSENFK